MANNMNEFPKLGNVTTITKLDKTNFKDWLQDIEIELKLRKLYTAITDDDANEMVDLQARRIMLETMDREHRAQVRGYQSAKSILERLKISYAEATAARKYRILVKFFRYVKDPSDSIDAHIGKLDSMRADLLDMDFEVDEEIFLATVIGSLPAEFGNIMESWELADEKQKTKQNLIAKLLNKEADLKNSEAQALLSLRKRMNSKSTDKPRMSSAEIEERKKTSRCGNCKEIGHWWKECPKSKVQESGSKTRDDLKVSLQVGNGISGLKNSWIIDSGASNNMCRVIEWFKKLEVLDSPMQVFVGDGKPINVIGIGCIEFESTIDGKIIQGTLTNVLYVPMLSTNLISVGAVGKQGVTTTFGADKCLLIKDNVKILVGIKSGDVYQVANMKINTQTGKALVIRFDRSKKEWHEVLGHPSFERTAQTLKAADIEYDTKKPDQHCSDCIEGKAHNVSHPSRSTDRAEKVGEIVHIDLVHSGNKNETYCYYLLAKDEYGEYSFVYFISNKTEVCDTLGRLIIDFEVGSGQLIRVIQSDNGSEFINEKVKRLLQYERIQHQTSSPYTPQQNGFVERSVRTLNNAARTILLASKLDQKLWNEAIRTACYLINRTTTSKSSVTPYERFTGRQPFLGHLIRFGEPAHMLQKDHHLRKYDARTIPCYIVGYTNRRNTYRVYVPSLNKIVETCDVFVGEHKADPISNNEKLPEEKKVSIEAVYTNDSEGDESRHTNIQPSAPLEEEFANQINVPLIGRNLRPYITAQQLERFFDDIRQQDTQETYDQGHGTFAAVVKSVPKSISPVQLMLMINESDKSFLEPKSYDEAIKGPNRQKWQEAIKAEFEAHQQNNTWVITNRPKQGTVLTVKWVFKIKKDKSGNIERFKARLVARGFEQQAGVDFKETYAPVASIESIRLLIVLAVQKSQKWLQFDITTAFLNGEINETVFVEPPQGMELRTNECLLLKKALYGLKQAPRAWSSRFSKALKDLDFSSLSSDACVFVNHARHITIVTYVDDGIIFADSLKDCESVIKALNQHFKTNQVTGSVFLGIEICQTPNGVCLSQRHYIQEMIKRYNLEAKGISTPANDIKSLEEDNDGFCQVPYREAIGGLLYVALNTRPDILFTTIWLSRFSLNPTQRRWAAVQRVMRYLATTRDLCLEYERCEGPLSIDIFTDADLGGNKNYSTSGIVIQINGCPIVMKSLRQKSVALSTCEAEFIAASEGVKDLIWVRGFLEELQLSFDTPRVHIDNKPAVSTIKTQSTNKGLKHIRLRYSFIKQYFEEGLFQVEYIATEQQIADILTKEMNKEKLMKLLPLLGLRPCVTRTAMICLLMLSASINASCDQPMEVNYVEWVPSNYFAVTGIQHHSVNIACIDRCKVLANMFIGNISQSVQDVVNQSVEDCYRARERVYLPLVEELKDIRINNVRRNKRSNLGRELRTAASPGSFYGTFWIPFAQQIGQYQDLESAYNTVWDHEQHINKLVGDMNNVNARFKTVEDYNRASATAQKNIIDSLKSSVEKNEKIFANLPQIVRAISQVTIDTLRDADLLRDLIEGLRIGQVNIPAIKKIQPQYLSLDAKQRPDLLAASLRSARWSNFLNGLHIQFETATKSNDAIIFKAITFKEWLSDTRFRQYTGDKLMIHNSTNDCTKLFPEPIRARENIGLEINCLDQGRNLSIFDMSLSVTEVTGKNFEIATAPTVVRIGDERLIQCFPHKIFVNGIKATCPKVPFRLNISDTIELLNYTHKYEKVEIVNQERTEKVLIVKGKLDENFIQSMTMAEKELDKLSEANNKLAAQNLEVQVLAFVNDHPTISTIGAGSTLILVSCIVLCMICRKDPLIELMETQIRAKLVNAATSTSDLARSQSQPSVHVNLTSGDNGAYPDLRRDSAASIAEAFVAAMVNQRPGTPYPERHYVGRRRINWDDAVGGEYYAPTTARAGNYSIEEIV